MSEINFTKTDHAEQFHGQRAESIRNAWEGTLQKHIPRHLIGYHVPNQRASHLISDRKYKKLQWNEVVFLFTDVGYHLDIKIRDNRFFSKHVHSGHILSKISDNTGRLWTKHCLCVTRYLSKMKWYFFLPTLDIFLDIKIRLIVFFQSMSTLDMFCPKSRTILDS